MSKKKDEILDAEVIDDQVEKANPDFDDVIEVDNHNDNASELQIIEDLLPATSGNKDLTVKSKEDQLYQYISEISKYKLLSLDEEKELVNKLSETGDIEVAKKLVVANLRLVVKIAMEYRSAYKNVMDLIQEGNMGLMKAVSKYDPSKGAKLSYYASWWIKSYILKFILDNFRLIKIGTTAEQKKLFYNLMREKERLLNQGIEPEVKLLSETLGVSEKSVEEMDNRLSSRGAEVSLDTPVSDDGNSGTISDFMEVDEEGIEELLAHHQGLQLLEDNLQEFIATLKERDQEIFKKRLLSEVPPSLQSIADGYGVSRERIRQIESRLLDKLKVYMREIIR